jgi:hypothetical protein
MGYGLPTVDWYHSNLSSAAIGPHNLILGLMLYGGVVAALIYILLTIYIITCIFKYEDKSTTVAYATIAVISLMSLMEIYSIQLTFLVIIVTYYYCKNLPYNTNSLYNE